MNYRNIGYKSFIYTKLFKLFINKILLSLLIIMLIIIFINNINDVIQLYYI